MIVPLPLGNKSFVYVNADYLTHVLPLHRPTVRPADQPGTDGCIVFIAGEDPVTVECSAEAVYGIIQHFALEALGHTEESEDDDE